MEVVPAEDEWQVECSDEEKYDPEKTGTWCPSAEDIVKLYEALEKQKILKLNWKCPGRNRPESEKPVEDVEMKDESKTETEQKPPENPKQQQSTEFDFDDDDFDSNTKVTPHRLPGPRTPRSQKKVATMDKILQDVMKQRIQNSADREAKRRNQRSPRAMGTPQKGPVTTPLKPPATTPPSITMTVPQVINQTAPMTPPQTSSVAKTEMIVSNSSVVSDSSSGMTGSERSEPVPENKPESHSSAAAVGQESSEVK